MPRALPSIVPSCRPDRADVEGQSVPGRLVAVGDVHGALAPFVEVPARRPGRGVAGQAVRRCWCRPATTPTAALTSGRSDWLIGLERECRRRRRAGHRPAGEPRGDEPSAINGRHVRHLRSFADRDWRLAGRRRGSSTRRWPARARQRDPLPEVCPVAPGLMAAHPPGWLDTGRRSPAGPIRRWLRSRPIAARVGDVLFMHAGVSPFAPARDPMPSRTASGGDRAHGSLRRSPRRPAARPPSSDAGGAGGGRRRGVARQRARGRGPRAQPAARPTRSRSLSSAKPPPCSRSARGRPAENGPLLWLRHVG